MSFIPLFQCQTIERFLYANLILVRVSKSQRRSRKNKGMCFFPCRSLSSKKEKKIPLKMSHMNAINVLMFHCWHFDPINQEGNKDRSSDPWIVLRPAASAATVGHSAGERALSKISLD